MAATILGLALVAAPSPAGSIAGVQDGDTPSSAAPPGSTPEAAATPEPPAGEYCAPNWYRGLVNGDEVEHGTRPAELDDVGEPLESMGGSVSTRTTVVEQREGQYAVFEVTLVVTLDGVDHTLGTAPFPAYANYGDRSPSPGSSMSGRIVAATIDGRTWVQLTRATSGAYGYFAWDLGDCVSRDEAAAAEARPGAAAYTG